MKRLLVILLSLVMLFAFVACIDEHGSDDSSQPGNSTPDESEGDASASDMLSGMIGIGTGSGTACFDELKVVSKSSYKEIFKNDLEAGTLPAFAYTTEAGGDWDKDAADFSVAVDPIGKYEEGTEKDDKNHVIAFTGNANGSFAYCGDKEWNYYQYSLKVLPTDENTIINLYFCITDENNYFVLSLGEDRNTKADCYRVVDGEKASVVYKAHNVLSLDKWTTVVMTVERQTIDIYIDGALYFSIFNPDFVGNYYAYEGERIPASISACNYGAPGEGLTYFQVDESHVLHDGKGTYWKAKETIASMAFDMDITTFYDCDENREFATPAELLVGMPGDGSFETSYVGAWIEGGVRLTHIRYCPRSDFPERMAGGIFQASVDGETWVDLHTIGVTPSAGDFVTVPIEDSETVYKYVRYVGPTSGYGNVAEIEIWGRPVE